MIDPSNRLFKGIFEDSFVSVGSFIFIVMPWTDKGLEFPWIIPTGEKQWLLPCNRILWLPGGLWVANNH